MSKTVTVEINGDYKSVMKKKIEIVLFVAGKHVPEPAVDLLVYFIKAFEKGEKIDKSWKKETAAEIGISVNTLNMYATKLRKVNALHGNIPANVFMTDVDKLLLDFSYEKRI